MRSSISTALLAVASIAAIASSGPARAQGFPGGFEGGGNRGGGQGRGQMEACTNKVLSGLVRAKASEAEAGPAVVSRCNGPLRAAVAEAIRSGEAFICNNVDACMPMAQERASNEARDLYRRMQQR
jgi:hypothetical protein